MTDRLRSNALVFSYWRGCCSNKSKKNLDHTNGSIFSDLILCYSVKLVFSLLANRIKDNILTFHFQVVVAFQKMFCFP